ncbi:MAG: helix-hairpin-helix domain-containing protein [Anaerolineales bacterium]|nr:helix-hairpin-helix domain-containing protein [Anaerolineales bacterium]
MKKKPYSNFLIGFLISGLVWLIFWYWQKSTSAEDGALDLLDRLAAAEARVQAAQARLAQFQRQQVAVAPDDLTEIKGIGSVFAQRLQAAQVVAFAQVADLAVEQLAELLDIGPNRAADIVGEAQKLVG